MSIGYQLVTQGTNDSVQSFVAAVSAALSALGPIGLQDAVLTRLEDMAQRPRLRLTLSYSTASIASMAAAYFGVTAGPGTPDAQAAAFFAANPLFRALFVRDVGDERRGGLDSDATMIIYATTPLSNCGMQRARPMVVQALGNIPSGSSGPCQLVSASGLVTGSVISNVVNRFDTTWLAGTRGYAIARQGSCIVDGFKTCC